MILLETTCLETPPGINAICLSSYASLVLQVPVEKNNKTDESY